jgi:hypothetical protein
VSSPVGPGNPPAASRFRKGQSGNPKGRPKREKARVVSAFDIVFDKTLTVTREGVPRQLAVEEALQHRTYQEAVAGNRPARGQILRMIAKREQYLAAHPGTQMCRHEFRTEIDPENADAALLILGIAARHPSTAETGYEGDLRLESWAVQAALSRRRGGDRLTDEEMAKIRRCTREPDKLRWPRRSGE